MVSQTFGHYQIPITANLEDLDKILLTDFFNRYSSDCSKPFLNKLYTALVTQSQQFPEKAPIFDVWLHKSDPVLYFSINPESITNEEQLIPKFLCFAPAKSL